jgi:uracil-DNA glycosylase family 4
MSDFFEELYNFFKAQRILYGSQRPWENVLSDDTPRIPIPALSHEQVEQSEKISEKGELSAFYHQIKDCMKCPLGQTRTHFVFGMGNPHAALMLVGEAPGREEDLRGEPFVGRAGQLLDLMLHAISLSRRDVFIANVLKCRPPNNRDPLPAEIEKCEPYLLKQIEIIAPRLIVALGRFASASLLRTKAALGNLRNEIHEYNNVPLLVTYHPAALLRNPGLKKQAWEDLKRIAEILKIH